MKKAIFTLAIGDNPMYQAAILAFKHYAKRVNADVIVADSLHYPINIESPKYSANPAWAEKLYIGELLKTYDRVLYVDADLLIHPEARDIFELYPELDTVYMLNEGAHVDRSREQQLIEQELGKINWPKEHNMPIYYNVGAILISNQCPLFDFASFNGLQAVCNKINFYEQTLFNYEIFKNQLKHQALEKGFNRMDLFGQQDYLSADFIHYAGKGYAKNNRRRDVQFLRDFAELYNDVVDETEIATLKAHAWSLYMEKIHNKYPLPNFILTQLCKWFVPR